MSGTYENVIARKAVGARAHDAPCRRALIIIPLAPPSVNHYVKHTRSGRHYKTRRANQWDQVVRIFARGAVVNGKTYEVRYVVYLGKGQRGDTDNFAKSILDSLQIAGVITSDAKVKKIVAEVGRDWTDPRTEIEVIGL